jgi:hypothetical protein
METSNDDYNPGYPESTGSGQNPENPAPCLFYQSMAIDKDLSVYDSLFVTNNGTFGADVTIQGNLNVGGSIFTTGSINSGGGGNFSGAVAAAGGFVSGNPMRLPGASIGGALNNFTGAMNVGGLLQAVGGVSSPQVSTAEKLTIGAPPEAEVNPDNPLADLFFNQERYTAQRIFDTMSGRYLTVLAVYQNPDS